MESNGTLLETFWTVNVDSLLAVQNKNKDHAVLHMLLLLLKSLHNKQQVGLCHSKYARPISYIIYVAYNN